MVFETLTHTKLNKKTGEPLSENSVKIYRTLLNKISKLGYDTKDSLVKNQAKIVSHINSATNENHIKRQYYSAIFYALDEYSHTDQSIFYKAFQEAKKPQPK